MAREDLFRFFTANRGVPRKKQQNTTVKHDRLDDGVLQDMTAKAELFSKARKTKPTVEIDGKQREVEQWPTAIGDTFRLLHTIEDPAVLEAEDILPSLEPTRRVMQRFIGTEEFKQMKPDTTHDEITSAFAAMRAGPKLQELYSGELGDMQEEARNAEKQENKIERAEQNLEELREQARQMHQQGERPSKELRENINKQVSRKMNARHELAKAQKAMHDTPINVGAANVIHEAAKEAKKGVEIIHSLPGIGKGASTDQGKKMNADDALRLANMFAENPQLYEIARMLGRIIRDMRYKRARRMTGGVEEVVDVMLGNDLPQVLPSQLMHLQHPALKRWFKLRYIQRALLQRERRGTTEAGRGPLVAVVDESSSMSGQPYLWAKAVSMAITAMARKEKRDAAVVSFSSKGQLESWNFPWREPIDPAKMIDMASHNFRGMTETRDGLKLGREIIIRDEHFTRADLVLISDGNDHTEPEDAAFKDDLKNRGIRLQGIQVGGPVNSYLTDMCESVSSAMDLTGANAATDMLADNIN